MWFDFHFFAYAAGIDYTALVNNAFRFFPGVYISCMDITILEDVIVEPEQSFNILLTRSNDDSVLFPPNSINSAAITILDNDGMYRPVYIYIYKIALVYVKISLYIHSCK